MDPYDFGILLVGIHEGPRASGILRLAGEDSPSLW